MFCHVPFESHPDSQHVNPSATHNRGFGLHGQGAEPCFKAQNISEFWEKTGYVWLSLWTKPTGIGLGNYRWLAWFETRYMLQSQTSNLLGTFTLGFGTTICAQCLQLESISWHCRYAEPFVVCLTPKLYLVRLNDTRRLRQKRWRLKKWGCEWILILRVIVFK